MKTCAVAICTNGGNSPNISMHRFPRDSKLREIWVSRCRRKDPFNPETARICSAHFKHKDFKRDFQAELLGSRPRAMLKPNVIPTLNLKPLNKREVNFLTEARQQSMLKKNEKEKHNCFVESVKNSPSTTSEVKVEVMDEDSQIEKERYDLLLNEKYQLENELTDKIKESETLLEKLHEAETEKLEALEMLETIKHEQEEIDSVLDEIFFLQ